MTTTYRTKLIETVESDINTMGWDLPARLFVLRGEIGDEYLEMFTEVDGHPAEFIEAACSRLGPIPGADVVGLAVVTEGWTYPEAVSRSLAAESPEQQREFYMMMPPSQHPERREVRAVILVGRDETVTSINRIRGLNGADDEVFASESKMDGRLIDAMKMALGLNADFNAAWERQGSKSAHAYALETTIRFLAGGAALGSNPSREAREDFIRKFCRENNLPDDLAAEMIRHTKSD